MAAANNCDLGNKCPNIRCTKRHPQGNRDYPCQYGVNCPFRKSVIPCVFTHPKPSLWKNMTTFLRRVFETFLRRVFGNEAVRNGYQALS